MDGALGGGWMAAAPGPAAPQVATTSTPAISPEAFEAKPVVAAPPPAPRPVVPTPLPSDLQAYLDQQEREILVRALHESGFNRTAAAARLGMSLRQIRYRIARLGINTPNGDDGASSHVDD